MFALPHRQRALHSGSVRATPRTGGPLRRAELSSDAVRYGNANTGVSGPLCIPRSSESRKRVEQQVCASLPRGVRFSGPQGQGDREPSHTLTSPLLSWGRGLVRVRSCPGSCETRGAPCWAQLPGATRIVAPSEHPREPLVPGRPLRSSGLALPLSATGRRAWGRADRQPALPSRQGRGGLAGPGQAPEEALRFRLGDGAASGASHSAGAAVPTPAFAGAAALGLGLPLVSEWRPLTALKPLLLSRPPATPPAPHLGGTAAACSPAELARVIHVGARLNVPLFRVVDGGGSGISPAQDEHEAVEGDGGRVLVVCGESRPGRSGHRSGPLSPSLPQGPPEEGGWRASRAADRPADRPRARGHLHRE